MISQSPGRAPCTAATRSTWSSPRARRSSLVPDVTGKSVDDARQILRTAGFQVQVTHVFPWIVGGNVVAQSPNGTDQGAQGQHGHHRHPLTADRRSAS